MIVLEIKKIPLITKYFYYAMSAWQTQVCMSYVVSIQVFWGKKKPDQKHYVKGFIALGVYL